SRRGRADRSRPRARRGALRAGLRDGARTRLRPAGGACRGERRARRGTDSARRSAHGTSWPGKNAPLQSWSPGSGALAVRPARVAPSAAGNRLRHSSPRTERAEAPPDNSGLGKNVDTTTRNPMLSLRSSGSFLLRTAQRTFLGSLLNAPPRKTR